MRPASPSPKSGAWFFSAGKGVAVAASTGAALVSIVSALYSYGVIGKSESHQSFGNLGAAWVRLRPSVDTAHAIGDTIYFAATVADRNGSILINAKPTWTVGDSLVASIAPDGAVIARGPGKTTVSVVVGSLVAQSKIVVKQRVAGVVVVSGAATDSGVIVLEGSELQLRARALDARGHNIVQAGAVWHIDDSSVATLDNKGILNGRNAGRSVVSARIDGASGYLPISVVTTAVEIDVVAGGTQRAPAGKPLAQPIVIRATNRRGAPAPNKNVVFRLEGTGKVEPASAVTDADGRARALWTLGEYPGRQRLMVTVENIDSAKVVVAEADPIPANTRIAAIVDEYRAPAGGLIADSVAIRVTDSTGRALADVPVTWTAVDGGMIVPIAPRTDSLGLARAQWTLAARTGTQRARAEVGAGTSGKGIPPATLKAMALPGVATAIAIVSGDRQRAAAASALKKDVVFRVTDANGNGVGNASVVLSLSGGSVPDTTLRADSLGYARARWTLGRPAGEYTLAAHVDGVRQLLKVNAVAVPAAPANLSFDDAPDKTRTRSKSLYAIVTDVYGNPVADAPVTFSSKSGTVTPARAVTDARGRVAVRWTPGVKIGEQTLSGVVRGTDVKGAYVHHVAGPTPQARASTAPARSDTKTKKKT